MPIPAWKPSKKSLRKWTLFFDFPGFADINCGMNCGTSRKGVGILQDLQHNSCTFSSIYGKRLAFLQVLSGAHRIRTGDLYNANRPGSPLRVGRPQTTKENIPPIFYKHHPAFVAGTLNISEFARLCGMSRPTIYKYLKLLS